jgi:hypothetical protein
MILLPPPQTHSSPRPSNGAQRSLAGGNWIADRPKVIDVYPPQDTMANILLETSSNGGIPYNLLVDLARLQAPFPLQAVGLIGEDEAVSSSATIVAHTVSTLPNCIPA